MSHVFAITLIVLAVIGDLAIWLGAVLLIRRGLGERRPRLPRRHRRRGHLRRLD